MTALAEGGEYEITVTAGEHGSIRLGETVIEGGRSGTITVNEGESVTFTIAPDEGYAAIKLLVDGSDQKQRASETFTHTFENVDSDHSIDVTFSRIIEHEIKDDTIKKLLHDPVRFNIPEPITEADMLTLTKASFDPYIYDKITDISGLEYAKNIEQLWLNANDISDLTPLKELTNLKELYISSNPNLSDLTPLEGLSNLTVSEAYECSISDCSALENLTNLTSL